MREYKNEANRLADQKKDLEKKIDRLTKKAIESCPRPNEIATDENTERRLIQTLENDHDAEREIMRKGFQYKTTNIKKCFNFESMFCPYY